MNTSSQQTSKHEAVKKKRMIIGGIAAVGSLIIVVSWFSSQIKPAQELPPPTPVTQTVQRTVEPSQLPEPTTAPAQPVYEEIVAEPVSEPLPPIVSAPSSLNESAAVVLTAIADINPELAQWLIPSEQLRKWVLTIDLIADGKLPKRYRPVDYPVAKFITEERDIDTLMSEDNYPRMNPLINAITSIEPDKLARYYQQWQPILEQAYKELGKKDTFNQRFQLAVSQVLQVEPLQTKAQLERPSVLFRYASPTLESANDVEKILWRMGPDNSEHIQGFLRELRSHIES